MRIRKTKTKNTEQYAIIYDVNINGKRTTKIYENLGTIDKIKLKSNGEEPINWLKKYVNNLNKKIKEESLPIILKKSPTKKLEKNKKYTFNGGYLFLQKIYYDLGIDKICNTISNKYQFKYDLNNILSNLIYSRIIYPSSKLKTLELSKNFIEGSNFEYNHVLRALEVICKENDLIQSELYKNSNNYLERNNKVLYYDCTNFFFEIEEEDGLKQYGKSKENRPNPIVQMGLFMDGDGLPMAFDITPGNTNEQITLKPLEKKIIKDFETSEFVVCTDAGLASNANRKFNNINGRKYITTQSIKKLKGFLKEWALDLSKGWKLSGNDKTYNISKLRDNDELIEAYRDKIFYKERWIKEDGLEQRLIVTYSVKYQEYQKNIRQRQVDRAQKLIDKNPSSIGKVRQNDPKRFINKIDTTENGEVASETHYSINQEIIDEEAKYDGLYAVCTNLEDNVKDIIKVNSRRWEIEESFRIMKTDFKSRPVYLSRNDRIKAHFITCFLALTIYRYLEKIIGEEYTTEQIIDTLRNYNFKNENDLGYSPLYERTDLLDKLHDKMGFDTSYEIIENKKMKKFFQFTKR
jgi:transposase